MPSKTEKQRSFMAACAHGWKPTKGKCPPQKVSREFNQADKALNAKKGKPRGRG